MKFLNHTPHAITVETAVGPLTFAPQPQAVRLEQIDSEMVSISGIGVIQRHYGSGTLPEPKDGIGLIVSQIVSAAFPERRDLFYPGDLVRDTAGNIVGCKNLCQTKA